MAAGVAPVEIGRGGGVGELRGPTVELSRGSARVEEGCIGGSAAASSSPGLRVDGGAGLGSLGRERAIERGECVAELSVVLMRSIDGGLGLCPGLATAAARWRPRSLTEAAWRGKEGSSAGESGARGLRGCRVWRWAAGGGLPASLSSGGAALRWRQRKQRGREEKDDSWTCLQFQKSLRVLL